MAGRRLAQVRAVYRRRGTAPTPHGWGYLVYIVVLLIAVVGAPAVAAIASLVQEPAVFTALGDSAVGVPIGAVGGALLAGLAVIGTMRGPVVLTPFLTVAIAGNDLPRHRSLLRTFASSVGVLVLLFTAVAVVIGGALSGATNAETGFLTGIAGIAEFIAASAVFGVLAGVVWLIGQRTEGTVGAALGPALAVATILGAGFPPIGRVLPWGWFAATWPGAAGSSALDLAGLALLACLLVLSVPSVLDGLRGEALLGQARRWQRASVASAAGDIAGAVGRFRAHASFGRDWRAVGSSPRVPVWTLAAARSDVVGALRTPVRLSVGVLGLGLGGWLMDAAIDVPGTARWFVAGLAAVSAYAGLGVVSDGLRHAVDATVGPRIYGGSDLRLLVAHTLAPATSGMVLATAGVLAHRVQDGAMSWGGSAAASVLVLTLVLTRLFDSAKGQLPAAVLAPVVTPAGDLSAVAVVAWQLDAVLIAVLLGVGVVGTFTVWAPAAGAAGVAVVVAGLIVAVVRRLRAL